MILSEGNYVYAVHLEKSPVVILSVKQPEALNGFSLIKSSMDGKVVLHTAAKGIPFSLNDFPSVKSQFKGIKIPSGFKYLHEYQELYRNNKSHELNLNDWKRQKG